MDHIFAFSHVPTRYLALGPRFGQVLVAQAEGFGSRRSFWADFRGSGRGRGWRYQGGAGDIQILPNEGIFLSKIIFLPFPISKHGFLALGPRFGLVLSPQWRLLRLPEVAIWEIFESLGGMVMSITPQVYRTTKMKHMATLENI